MFSQLFSVAPGYQRAMFAGIIAIPLLLLLATCTTTVPETGYTRYVNPFIGTDGTGHCFPGPAMPFGMVQPGPDNVDKGWDHTSGYQYKDSIILGFSQTRANGTGISEFGDVLLQPVTTDKTDSFGEPYQKDTERASPGYYTVTLRNGVQVELTCTERVALHQYQYPDSKAGLLVDLQHGLRFLTDSLVLESAVTVENATTISGYCHTKNWVMRKYFFTIQFNHPFVAKTQLARKPKEAAPRYLLRFELPDRVLQTKIALSTVSIAGAKLNLQQEMPGWDFTAVTTRAQKVWDTYLSRINITATPKQREIFYTSLYRLFLQPSNIADADGRYRGADDSIRMAPNGEYYSTLSLWDTYRAAHPLYTLIAPERVSGFVNTMIAHADAAGFLPIWTAWGQDNYCMIGNHAIPVIADAYLKGFRGFDTTKALQKMIATTTQNHINSNWTLLDRFGYYPLDGLDNESVSRTLEHGVDDYCIALMAQKMGRADIALAYYKRAARYKNLYDTTTKQLRGKDSKGRWRTPFNPLLATSPMNNPGDYTEANAWQYFWTPAQYDVSGLIQLLNGRKAFTDHLDSFFSIKALHPNKHLGQEAMIGQYAHANEPSHHIAYLYAYSDTPQKGLAIVKQICDRFYNNTPHGMIGNDDCGQMSAWYIFATLGFYPVNPANGNFVLGHPQVTKAIIQTGKTALVIEADLNINTPQTVRFNDKLLTDQHIGFPTLQQGGRLVFGGGSATQ
jgi:predicted alpha-1,2-mannosidase